MSRTFQDRDFLVWEVYPSAGENGSTERAQIIFNCLTDPARRARRLDQQGDEADAQRLVVEAEPAELLAMFERSSEVR